MGQCQRSSAQVMMGEKKSHMSLLMVHKLSLAASWHSGVVDVKEGAPKPAFRQAVLSKSDLGNLKACSKITGIEVLHLGQICVRGYIFLKVLNS